MTPNRSFAISVELKEIMRTDILPNLSEDFPYDIVNNYQPTSVDAKPKRDRIYNDENTLLTMLATAIGEDKSLRQSVTVFKDIFESRGKEIKQREAVQLQLEQEEENRRKAAGMANKRGPRRHYSSRLPKSKQQEVSDNTAAYAMARSRVEVGLMEKVFEYSADFKELNGKPWHGMEVFITDGTYLQLQDTPKLRAKYFVKEGDNAYPQALLQTMVRQGSGQVHAFGLGTRHQSELELLKPLLDKLPEGSLLLADDLYNTYAVFCLLQKKDCHIIVPGKRKRKHTVIKTLSTNDEIVALPKTGRPEWLSKEEWEQLPSTIIMRRIVFPSPFDPNQQCVQYTSLTDETISTTEIILKYATRWDIEITVREIKTLMDINIIRGKTEDMVKKEITTALTAYNMVRKIISKSVEQTDFSPQNDLLYERFKTDKKLLVDKKGRVYHHWSAGRYGPLIEEN